MTVSTTAPDKLAYDYKALAKALDKSKRTLQRWVKANRIPAPDLKIAGKDPAWSPECVATMVSTWRTR